MRPLEPSLTAGERLAWARLERRGPPSDRNRQSSHIVTMERVLTAEPSDEIAVLIGRLANRDSEAFGRLYDGTSGPVFSLLMRILDDPAAAEAVAREVYLEYWRAASRFDPARDSGLAWMTMIARRRAIDRRRSRPSYGRSLFRLQTRPDARPLFRLQTRPDAQPLGPSVANPDRWAHLGERLALVAAALGALPPERRQVVELAFFEGLRNDEIATVTGMPLSTVRGALRAALRSLRDVPGPSPRNQDRDG